MRRQVVFDTNILIYFFDGNQNAAALLLQSEFFVSAMTHVELLSDLNTTPAKRALVKDLLSGITIIQTTPFICERAAKFRLSYALKLPDAIIAATALHLNFPLITGDSAFFKIKEIELIPFIK